MLYSVTPKIKNFAGFTAVSYSVCTFTYSMSGATPVSAKLTGSGHIAHSDFPPLLD